MSEPQVPPPAASPLTLQALLDDAVRRARGHFKEIYFPVAVPLAVLAALIPLVQLVVMRDFMSTAGGPPPDTVQMLLVMGPMVVVGLVIGVVWGLSYSALQVAATDAVAGRPVSMKSAWGRVVQPRFFGTQILAGLALLLGFCACVIPGIYLVLLWGVIVPVMVEEARFGREAMSRSAALLRHNPQGGLGNDPRVKVFLVLFVGMVLQYAASFIVQLPFVVVQQVLMFRSISSGQRVDPGQMFAQMTWINVPSQALGMLVQTAVQLYVAFGVALLFFDARARKEGTDLEDAIAGLAPAPPPSAP